MNQLKIWTINAVTGVATSDDGEKRLVHGERWITEADAMRLQDEISRLKPTTGSDASAVDAQRVVPDVVSVKELDSEKKRE